MNDTLQETLNLVVAPYIPPQLISPTHLSHIGEVACSLPGAISSFFGFECRLGERVPRADFLACIKVADGGREILAGQHPTTDLPETLFNDVVWQRVRLFSRHWANQESILYKQADNIWVEFDIDGPPSNIPVPSLFFGPKRIQSRSASSPQSTIVAHPHQWITRTALPLVLGNFLPQAAEQKLFECFDALPVDAEVFQIGVMLARKSEVVRLCVRNIAPVQIPAYLARLGWSGQEGRLRTLMTELSSGVGSINLNFDVSDRILPKIGLECYFDIPANPWVKLQQFLDHLVGTGLCLPEKRDALFAYIGQSCESNHELWPTHLRHASRFLNGKFLSAFFRTLHHIKIVYQPDSVLEAKAYLAVNHCWMPLSQIQPRKEALQYASI